MSFVTQPDGAHYAYDIVGKEHSPRTPLVLIGGLSSRRGDWETLSSEMAKIRPVIFADHRGMGDSKYAAEDKSDAISIESMARDLVHLLNELKFKEYILLGFSMGGVITQQIMLLLETSSVEVNFKVTHFILTGTLYRVMERGESKMPIRMKPIVGPLTEEAKLELARPMLNSTFDDAWLKDPKNAKKYDWWLKRMTTGRPVRTISSSIYADLLSSHLLICHPVNQALAINSFDFEGQFKNFSYPAPVLIIHGEKDIVVPYKLGYELTKLVPGAKMVGVGSKKGEIPNIDFGHHWYEYFDIQIWVDAIEEFLKKNPNSSAKL